MAITGATLSAPLYLSFLQGCTPSGNPGWTSTVLDEQQVGNLISYSNQLFPGGDLPSAGDVNVAECVDLLLTDCRSEEDQAHVQNALAALDGVSQEKFKRTFSSLNDEQQIQALTSLENTVYADGGANRNSYVQLKSLVMLAYFTTKEVMQNQLNYNPLPGRHDACIDLGADGRVFEDNNV